MCYSTLFYSFSCSTLLYSTLFYSYSTLLDCPSLYSNLRHRVIFYIRLFPSVHILLDSILFLLSYSCSTLFNCIHLLPYSILFIFYSTTLYSVLVQFILFMLLYHSILYSTLILFTFHTIRIDPNLFYSYFTVPHSVLLFITPFY